MKNKSNNSVRRFKNLGAGLGLAAVLLVVMLNFVVGLLADRINLRADLTESGDYTISAESREFLEQAEIPVNIFVLSDELLFKTINHYFYRTDSVLKEYARVSDKISLEYIDLLKNPTFAARYPNYNLYDNDIIIESEGRTVYLSTDDIFETRDDEYGITITGSRVEQAVATAILELASPEKNRVYTLSGHGEQTTGYTSLSPLLSANNISLYEANTVIGDIPEEAKILLIAAPLVDVNPDEVAKLENFVAGGGHIIYFADISQPPLPNLEGFLEKNGALLERGAVFESDMRFVYNYNSYFPVLEYLDNDYAADLIAKSLVCTSPYSRPMKENPSPGSETVALLRFSATSGLVPEDAGADWVGSAADISPNIPAVIESVRYDGGSVTVFGSLAFVDSSVLENPSLGNARYFLNLINSKFDRPDALSVTPKTIEMQSLYMNTAQVTTTAVFFIALLPLAITVAGIFVRTKRKKL